MGLPEIEHMADTRADVVCRLNEWLTQNPSPEDATARELVVVATQEIERLRQQNKKLQQGGGA